MIFNIFSGTCVRQLNCCKQSCVVAYIIYWNVSHEFGKSLIYIKNKSGPKIEPCGTPVVMGKVSEIESL